MCRSCNEECGFTCKVFVSLAPAYLVLARLLVDYFLLALICLFQSDGEVDEVAVAVERQHPVLFKLTLIHLWLVESETCAQARRLSFSWRPGREWKQRAELAKPLPSAGQASPAPSAGRRWGSWIAHLDVIQSNAMD